jgi:hypothetical protein
MGGPRAEVPVSLGMQDRKPVYDKGLVAGMQPSEVFDAFFRRSE